MRYQALQKSAVLELARFVNEDHTKAKFVDTQIVFGLMNWKNSLQGCSVIEGQCLCDLCHGILEVTKPILSQK